MKFFIKFFIITASLGMYSCDKTKFSIDYTFDFKLTNSGAAYALDDFYTTSQGVDVKMESLRFYMANIIFVNDENEDVIASEIELITFGLSGTTSINFQLPVDKYSKIKFGIGVPQAMNEADPATYNTIEGHPLSSTNNTYWGWTAMYRFVMLEGRFDADGDGVTEGLISMHTGYNSSYRELEFPIDLKLKKKESYSSEFEFDVYKFFDPNSADIIDIASENQYHGSQAPADLDLADRLSNNFAAALTLKQ